VTTADAVFGAGRDEGVSVIGDVEGVVSVRLSCADVVPCAGAEEGGEARGVVMENAGESVLHMGIWIPMLVIFHSFFTYPQLSALSKHAVNTL